MNNYIDLLYKYNIMNYLNIAIMEVNSNSFNEVVYNDFVNTSPNMGDVFTKALKHLLDNIDNIEIVPNELFNKLLLLKESKFPYIKEIINKSKYEDLLINKYNNNEYSEFVIEGITFLNYDSAIINVVINNCIKNNTIFTFQTLVMAIKNFVKRETKKKADIDVDIIIDYLEEFPDHLGRYKDNIIYVNINLLRLLYREGNPRLLETIYHEIRHHEKMNDIDFEKDELFAKEMIICLHNDDYYNENYKNLSYEDDARYYGLKYLIDYLKENNIKIDDVLRVRLKEFEEKCINNKNVPRTLNGMEINIDELLDEIINKLDNETIKR